MATNRRDVELGIAVETAGAEEIQKLATEVRQLAQQGGDAAPEFARLANEIDKIAGQVGAVSSFAELRAQVDALAAAQAQAAAKAEPLAKQYQEISTAAKASAAAASEAKLAEIDATRSRDEARLKLQLLRLETDKNVRSTDEYKAAIKSAKIELQGKQNTLAEAKKNYLIAADAAKAAKVAEEGLRDSYQSSQKALASASDALQARSVELLKAEGALKEAGVATANLAQEEARLRSELQSTSRYAQELQADIVRLAAAERELAATNAFDKQAADAKKLLQAGEYVQFWEKSLREAEVAQKSLAESSRQAAGALDAAFAKIGIRSAASIKNEINEINAALAKMARDSRVSGADFDRAFAAAQERVKALNAELTKTPGEIEKAGVATNFLRSSIQQLAAIYGGIELGTQFIDAANQLETLRRTLTVVTGSTAAAGQQIDLLRNISNRTGQSVSQLGQDFSIFTAATTQAGLSLADSNRLFETMTVASGQLGLSTQRTGLILTALGQIASKGKVSLEELQGQLGESLPGALAVTAKGLGVTTERLVQLVETGNLSAKEFFPAFQKGVADAFGTDSAAKVQTFAAAWNRLKNALTETSQKAVDTQAFKTLTQVLDLLASNLTTVIDATYALGKAFLAVKVIDYISGLTGLSRAAKLAQVEQTALTTAVASGATAKAVDTAQTIANTEATVANTVAKRASTLAWGTVETGIRLTGTAAAETAQKTSLLAGAMGTLRGAGSAVLGALGGIPGAALIALLNIRELGDAVAKGAAKLFGYTGELERNEKKLADIARAEREAADARSFGAAETERAKDAALGLTEAGSRLVDIFKKQVKDGNSVTESLQKMFKEFDTANIKGIYDAGSALDRLASDGKISAAAVSEAWRGALKDIDLRVFETNARAAFDNTVAGARRLEAALNAIGEEALRRAGTSLNELTTGFSSGINKAINNTDILRETLTKMGVSAEQTGVLLAKSLDQEIALVTTAKAAERVIERVEEFGKAGSLAGLQYTDSLDKAVKKSIEFANTADDLKRVQLQIEAIIRANPQMASAFASSLDTVKKKLAEVDPALRRLNEDAKLLGITLSDSATKGSESMLQAYERIKLSGKATSDQVTEAFKVTAEAAIKAANGQIPEWVKVEAALRNVQVGVDSTGKAFIDMGKTAVGSINGVVSALGQAATALTAFQRQSIETKSILPGQTYDSQKFATNPDGSRFSVGGQLNIPEGYYFDSAAANKDPRFQLGQIDGSQFIKRKSSTAGNGGSGPFGGPGSGYVPPPPAPTGGGTGGTSVNINLNGTTTRVNVSSTMDAQLLTNLLKQLAEQGARAG